MNKNKKEDTRNAGIIGVDSKEVFEALIRHSYKRDEYKGYAVPDNHTDSDNCQKDRKALY